MEKNVSVVIPSYNRAHLLMETIPSYIQPNVLEVIIVDDCSTDDTRKTIEKLMLAYPQIKYLKTDVNSKQTVAKNIGKKAAVGEYIYFGDDDSFITKDTISILLGTLKEYNADAVAAKALYMNNINEIDDIDLFINNNSKHIQNTSKYLDINNLFNISFDFDTPVPISLMFTPACTLVKSSICKEIDFSTDYTHNCYREETDFFTRISSKGYKIYYDSRAVQINLPRHYVSTKYSKISRKILNSIYEFINTYRYLKNNEKYINIFYCNSDSFMKVWIKYMIDAFQVKSGKFFKLICKKQ